MQITPTQTEVNSNLLNSQDGTAVDYVLCPLLGASVTDEVNGTPH